MQIYVAGSLADISTVREVQRAVVSAGHDVILDWTSGPDSSLTDYSNHSEAAQWVASDDLRAVVDADAVILVASGGDGIGMFVEFGAALLRAEQGDLAHVVVVGTHDDQSVFFHHPAVTRVATVAEWLAGLRRR